MYYKSNYKLFSLFSNYKFWLKIFKFKFYSFILDFRNIFAVVLLLNFSNDVIYVYLIIPILRSTNCLSYWKFPQNPKLNAFNLDKLYIGPVQTPDLISLIFCFFLWTINILIVFPTPKFIYFSNYSFKHIQNQGNASILLWFSNQVELYKPKFRLGINNSF